jgi:hypothetical protein
MIRGLIEVSELSYVEMFTAGVEPENFASVRALVRAGFCPSEGQPDFEGIVYYARRRS